jgi:predicted lipoprotein with Yx(FWY)xxD motif
MQPDVAAYTATRSHFMEFISTMKRTLIATLFSTVVAASAFAQSAPTKWVNGLLVDAKGMTLYTFDKDANNKSNCNDSCLKVWPALVAGNDTKVATPYSIVARDDGGKQIALNGKPLYTYAADQKAGDVTGDNSGGVWHAIREKK